MASLAEVFVTVAADTSRFEPDLKRKLSRIDASKDGRRVGGKIGGGISTGMKAAFAGLAGLGIGALFTSFINEARESEKISRVTANAIKATGGAAKVTASQVSQLATSLSNKTAVDDELVQSGANLLLTFKNIRNEAGKGNDIFNQATAAALDLSAAGFGSVESASKMLGKALNDPLKGITALSRAGVTFTEEQKKQIKTLVESGNVLGAQKVIMQEVASQVGGAAKASADPMQRLGVIIGNVKESIGGALLPVVERLAGFLTDKAIPAFGKAREAFASLFSRSGDAAGQFGEIVDNIFGNTGKLIPLFTLIGTGIRNVVLGVKALVASFRDGDVTSDGFIGAMERVGVTARLVFDFLKDRAVPALKDVGRFVADNATAFKILAVAVGGGVIAFKAFRAVVAVQAAITVVTTAIHAMNLAMRANPIGLVVTALGALVAGLVFAYKNSETFREIVDTAFRAVAGAGQWMWNNVLSPVFGFFANTITKVIVPAVRGMWNFITGAFKGIATVANWLWHNVLFPIFDLWRKTVGVVLIAAFRAWFTVVSTVFKGIAAAAQFAWDKVLRPVLQFLGDKVVWVGKKFGEAKDLIGRLWDQIKEKTKGPINFVIDVVYNKGIRSIWNTVAGLVGAKKLGAIPLLERGGVFNTPTAIVGEGNTSRPEFVIPTDPRHRQRALALYEQLGTQLMERGGILGTLGKIGSGVRSAVGKGIDIAKAAAGVFTDPIGTLKKLLGGPLKLLDKIKSTQFGAMIAKIPGVLVGKIGDFVKGLVGKLGGGGGGAGVTPAAFASLSPFKRVTWRGKTVSERTRQQLIAAERIAGFPLPITQGSWSTSVAASAGTHAGGGVVDLSSRVATTAVQTAMRKAGFAAWIRTPAQGPWGRHIHAVSIGDPSLAPAARRQVSSYLRGGIGLAGYDTGGVLKPGWTMAYNGTRKDELVLRQDQLAVIAGGRGREYHFHFAGRETFGPRDAVEAMERAAIMANL